MVLPKDNLVQMGVGDVGILYTAQGTRNKPIGEVIFYNQKKQPITVLPEDVSIIDGEIEQYTSYPDQEIALSFSSPESIDSLISVLQAVKKNIFKDERSRKIIFSTKQEY